jgi:hypothetical protein
MVAVVWKLNLFRSPLSCGQLRLSCYFSPAFINYIKGFHCDISIYEYNTLWSNSPSLLFSYPSLSFLNNFNVFHCSIFITNMKYFNHIQSPPFTFSFHPSPPTDFHPQTISPFYMPVIQFLIGLDSICLFLIRIQMSRKLEDYVVFGSPVLFRLQEIIHLSDFQTALKRGCELKER